jgi:hypothetical protein
VVYVWLLEVLFLLFWSLAEMGCRSSNNRGSDINEIGSVETNSKVIDIIPKKSETGNATVPPEEKVLYSGIRNGMAIICLDIFNSKYTGEKMARWRAAIIRDFDPKTLRLQIHFEGWKDKHDIFLQLPDDLARIAPSEILNDQEKFEGHILSESQYEATELYFKTGFLQLEETIQEPEELPAPTDSYYIGQLVSRSSRLTLTRSPLDRSMLKMFTNRRISRMLFINGAQARCVM